MNNVELRVFGYLGRDPEMRYLPSGKAVSNFSVAASRKWKNEVGDDVSETTWIRVSAFDKMAELCQSYLHKGSHVYVEGRLQIDPKTGGPRIWTRQDGSVGANFEILLSGIQFLDSKNGNGNGNGSESIDNEIPQSGNEPVAAGVGTNVDSDGFPL